MVLYDKGVRKIDCIDSNGEKYLRYFSEDNMHSNLYPNVPLKCSFFFVPNILACLPSSCEKILLLGLGLGATVVQIKEILPSVKITAVDIDQELYELGLKYFSLAKYKDDIDFICCPAEDFVQTCEQKFDIIIIDVFEGYEIPQKLIELSFWSYIKKMVSTESVIIFNTNMQRLEIFDTLNVGRNPINWIYSLLFNAGFSYIYQNDFGFGGWIFISQSELQIDVLKEKVNSQDQYCCMALLVHTLFTKLVNQSNITNLEVHALQEKGIVSFFRTYLLRCVMHIRRNSSYETGDALGDIFFKYFHRRFSSENIESIIRNRYICNNPDYYVELYGIIKDFKYKDIPWKKIFLPSDTSVLPPDKFSPLITILSQYAQDVAPKNKLMEELDALYRI